MLNKLKENIARITVNPKTRQILDIHLYERSLRFKCKRCAIYCCKLGGPNLTKEDTKQIEHTRRKTTEFVESVKRQYGNYPLIPSTLKSKKDGSCIFLRKDENRDIYECSIYDVRPALCKLYPFGFKRINAKSFLLRIIPSCNGLNSLDGELVNEEFITNHLSDLISEIFEESVRKGGIAKQK